MTLSCIPAEYTRQLILNLHKDRCSSVCSTKPRIASVVTDQHITKEILR